MDRIEIILKDWKEYLGDITTNSLWVDDNSSNSWKFKIPKRDFLPKNSSDFHGIFIPEIPYQFIKRFTKPGQIVWDCFGGSGTTYKVARLLERECVINDLNPKEDFICQGDSQYFNPGKKIDLVFCHPPYFNIVKYSNEFGDGSNFGTLQDFIIWFKRVCDNITQHLRKDAFCILVCGNIYLNSEEIELGEMLKNIFLLKGYTLKSHIVKEYGETKGGNKKNYNLNYYRQLKGNYNNFYGDNIYILQNKKSKNNVEMLYKTVIETEEVINDNINQ